MSIHTEEPNSVPDLPDSAQLNGNPLSRLFNKIRYDLGITPARVGLLVENYLNNPLNNIPKTGKERSTERGNLMKQLKADDMSIKVFLKALSVLQPKHIRFTVEFTNQRDRTTSHSIDFDVVPFDIDDNDDGSS